MTTPNRLTITESPSRAYRMVSARSRAGRTTVLELVAG